MAPLDETAFEALMRPLEPFEAEPELAIAVSGGRDSMALALLADAWARARGGKAIALTVDHGLRPDSSGEARQVKAWLATRGIAQRTLRWRGPKPEADVQEAARRARYALLGDWCRAHGVPHLLLGHQREDQAETFLMRLARGSGIDGLAAMAASRGQGGVRLLRPLLSVSRARLTATLRARGQAWIDDPSNLDPAFERGRLADAGLGIDAGRLAEAAGQAGHGRAALERAVARLAARAIRPAAAGFFLLDRTTLAAAPEAECRALLRRLLMTAAGAEYPPRSAPLMRLASALRQDRLGAGRTLAGCRLVPWRGTLVIARETRRLPPAEAMATGCRVRWDRFACGLKGAATESRREFSVAALGEEGWCEVRRVGFRTADSLPSFVVRTLPTLRDRQGVALVPHLNFRRGGTNGLEFSALFRPIHGLAPVPFTVASPPVETI